MQLQAMAAVDRKRTNKAAVRDEDTTFSLD
jgi:hypothetical protein